MYDNISTHGTLNLAKPKAEISALIHLMLKNQQESNENVHSLQKAIAWLPKQGGNFRDEHSDDEMDVKLELKVRRNKVWLSREAV